MSGPFDTPERCYRILSILEHSCGRDGFHYMLPLLDGMPEGLSHGVRLIGPGETEGDSMDDYLDEEDEEDA